MESNLEFARQPGEPFMLRVKSGGSGAFAGY
jgi:hypothetical protein